jgi:hypothetical protein
MTKEEVALAKEIAYQEMKYIEELYKQGELDLTTWHTVLRAWSKGFGDGVKFAHESESRNDAWKVIHYYFAEKFDRRETSPRKPAKAGSPKQRKKPRARKVR